MTYERLTPKLMMQLAAPHTWPAAIMPVLVSVALVYKLVGCVDVAASFGLLAIVVCMQASANTFNDYYDFVKGADGKNDGVEADDSVLVYNRISPRSVKVFAIVLLLLAFCIGVPLTLLMHSGPFPLIVALIGAVAVAFYSAGKIPISYLPVGELVSGIVMGGLITLACVYILSYGSISFMALLWSIPCIIGIALIMLANNTCDIEKDTQSGRKTFAVMVGHKRAQDIFRAHLILWNIVICILVAVYFQRGIIVLPFMVLAMWPFAATLWKCPMNVPTRALAMGQILTLNVILGAFYTCAILV